MKTILVPTPLLTISAAGGGPPVPNNERVTEANDVRVTEAGDIRVTN